MFWYSDQSWASASPDAANTSTNTNDTIRMTNPLLPRSNPAAKYYLEWECSGGDDGLFPPEEVRMAEFSFAAPILAGKTDAWRKAVAEIKGPRNQGYKESRKKLGIKRE